MSPPTTTALYGALNAILTILLANRVSSLRRKRGVSLGAGADGREAEDLFVAIRAHANNAESVPLALVVFLLVELCGGSSLWLHVLGGSLLLARIAHAFGLPRPAPNPYRFAGTAVTWVGIVAAAAYLLVLRFRLV